MSAASHQSVARPPLLAVLALLAGCAPRPAPPPPAEAIWSGPTMGTTYRVQLGAVLDPPARSAVTAAIARELSLVDVRMSAWREDSELTAFNRRRTSAPQPLSPETFEVLVEAERVAQQTGGAFDVTVGPLVEAWGYGPRGDRAAEPPTRARLATLRARVGWRLLVLDPIQGTAAKSHPELALDLDGIAPGYAVDRIAAALEELDWTDYLVEIGGEMRARGKSADDDPWQVGIERPEASPGAPARLLALTDRAVATSGDYRSFRIAGGRRINHIIDPRTGEPVQHALASATVLAERCMTADALATALMVMGPDEALAFAEREGLPVLLQVREGDGFVQRASSTFPEH